MRKFLLHSCVIPNLSAALIRRDCFFASGRLSKKYRACSDWELFFHVADGYDFFYIAEPLNRFRQHIKTIRSATSGRVTYDEFFRLLLGEIYRGNLTKNEILYCRFHVMYIWAVEIFRPSLNGLKNFPHHLFLIAKLDFFSLLFFPFAVTKRFLELPLKLFRQL
jgi:hypothetical protein